MGEGVHVYAEINPVVNGQRIEIDYDLVEKEVYWPPMVLSWHETRGGHTIARHIDPKIPGMSTTLYTKEEMNDIFLATRIWNANNDEPKSVWNSEGAAVGIISSTIPKNNTNVVKWLVYNDPASETNDHFNYKGSKSNVLGYSLMKVDDKIGKFEVWDAKIVLRKLNVDGKKSFFIVTSFPT